MILDFHAWLALVRFVLGTFGYFSLFTTKNANNRRGTLLNVISTYFRKRSKLTPSYQLNLCANKRAKFTCFANRSVGFQQLMVEGSVFLEYSLFRLVRYVVLYMKRFKTQSIIAKTRQILYTRKMHDSGLREKFSGVLSFITFERQFYLEITKIIIRTKNSVFIKRYSTFYLVKPGEEQQKRKQRQEKVLGGEGRY